MNKPLRILLVEDNPGDADLIREMLPTSEDSGFTVHCVTRLADAVAHLRKNETDLALLDLDLPDSQGIDTVRAARQAAPEMPIVVLTGHQDERMGIAAVQGGAQDFLVKGRPTVAICRGSFITQCSGRAPKIRCANRSGFYARP